MNTFTWLGRVRGTGFTVCGVFRWAGAKRSPATSFAFVVAMQFFLVNRPLDAEWDITRMETALTHANQSDEDEWRT
jgi:hypothetical protein